jgi:hypothetical protein
MLSKIPDGSTVDLLEDLGLEFTIPVLEQILKN